MTDLKPDYVNSPPHYMITEDIEVIDVRHALLEKMNQLIVDGKLTAVEVDYWSRAWEYLTRCFFKNGLEDAGKCEYYLLRLIKAMQSRTTEPHLHDDEQDPVTFVHLHTPNDETDLEPNRALDDSLFDEEWKFVEIQSRG